MAMRLSDVRRRVSLSVLLLAAGALSSTHATAGWPPQPGDDMSDPANWPNDPGYAYSPGPDGSDGAWNFYSFIPEQEAGSALRPEETASGMSIDNAWRHTLGDPRVLILVTDSGIHWDEPDLIETAWLNWRELVTHKPRNADGTACTGALDCAKLPGSPPCADMTFTAMLAEMDCNGDGILTVSDYKDTPALQPQDTDPKGDKNANGRLDPGDLILNFSDGVDDDGNGYVDDISGWDWMKGDNDPYDDTRYGHGTGEAKDSTAGTNNMIGNAGACPLCRHVPGRVGDSFIADVQAFAQAVNYSADNGVSIVQCALGTINMTKFAQASLDYAYDKGVLVVTSMADENARHHNVPAAANHTLPVHAIQWSGTRVTKADTFVAYHPCSNYGGQNLLSASGEGCSSEATGMLSGISGLLLSASLQYLKDAGKPTLSPGEAHQVFFMSADDIDVKESREPESPYEWSHEGFDQRFGYGRVNAASAVDMVVAGKIPPAVDVVSPRWFEILYEDQVTGPVEIHGTVSAKRANAYDVFAEWAPGVQPLDGEFVVFKEITNVPPDTILGADGTPLAELDIRTIDFEPMQRDPDSPRGENDAAITVRIRAVAHYGADKGDVRGEMRRTYYVHSDPDLVKGFPLYVGDSGESSPKLVDLDGDGVRDLVYPTSGGDLHVFKIGADGPTELSGFPVRSVKIDGLATPPPTPTTPDNTAAPAYAMGGVDVDLAREGLSIAPAIDDLDGDGSLEIVFSTFAGTIFVVGADGKIRDGWPRRLPEVPSCPLDPSVTPSGPCMTTDTPITRGAFAAPVLSDMDKDGDLDIIQAAFDGKIYVYDASGEQLDGWPVELHYTGKFKPEPERNRIMTTPAVGDFNGDGIDELLVGSNEKLGTGSGSGAIYLVDGRGNAAPDGPIVPGWPVTMTSFELFPLVAEGVPNSGVIGQFGDTLAAVMHGNASAPLILPIDPGEQNALGGTPTNAIPQRPDPYIEGETLRGVDPTSIFGPLSPAEPNTMFPLFAQPSLGDLDQDGWPDIVASGGSLTLAASLQSETKADGDHLIAMWSGKTGAMMPAAPVIIEDYTFFNSQAIVDLTGDDYPEVLTGSGGYLLHAVDACGREPQGWPKFTGQWIIPTPAVGDLDGDGLLEVVVGTRAGWLYAWHTKARASDSVIEWESFHHDNRNSGNLATPLSQGVQGKKAATPLTAATCEVVPVEVLKYEAGGGCGCRIDGRRDAQGLGALGALALATLLRRRRR